MNNTIFIGGTGRCGTNITRIILEKHPQVTSLPFEHRFMLDPDGIIDFYQSYSCSWSPALADKRIKRLEDFLQNKIAQSNLVHKYISKFLKFISPKQKLLSPQKYAEWELDKHIPHFLKYSQELIENLRDFSYPGLWPITESYQISPKIYYSSPKSRTELTNLFRDFLEKVLKSCLEKKQKKFYVEDNTWNILFAQEILELLPNAKILHLYRDPRDVVASFTHQRWSPQNPIKAAQWYKGMIKYWFKIKNNLPSNKYHEVKFEELIQNTKQVIKEICDFSGLNYNKKLLEVDLSKHHIGRWKKDFSKKESKEIQRILQPIIKKLNYE